MRLSTWQTVGLVVVLLLVLVTLWVWIGFNHNSHPTGPTAPQGVMFA